MRQLPFEYAYRNLGRSRVRLFASLLGSGLVVLLVLAAAGFIRGMQLTLAQQDTLHENVVILGAGSEESIERSQIHASVAGIAAASIAGLREAAGVTFVSPEIHTALPVWASADDDQVRHAMMRGVRPVALLVHSEVELVDGRPPRAGFDELMVGGIASTRLGLADERLAVGRTLYFDNRDWTIVGRFRAPNTVMDAEIWLPITDLQIATRRESSLSCVVVTLDTATFADVDIFAKSRLDLEIIAIGERDYYRAIPAFYRPIRILIRVAAAPYAIGRLSGGRDTEWSDLARVGAGG